MTLSVTENIKSKIEEKFDEHFVTIDRIEVRSYPGETIFLVYVAKEFLSESIEIGSELDKLLIDEGVQGFVTVKAGEPIGQKYSKKAAVSKLSDPRLSKMMNLVLSRARTSEMQPSLMYVKDAAENVDRIITPRHHLVFGRRGAGKTALILEAKRRLSEDGNNFLIWINVQTFRKEKIRGALSLIVDRVIESVQGEASNSSKMASLASEINALRTLLLRVSSGSGDDSETQIPPRTQHVLKRFAELSGKRLYIFLDDYHYYPRELQPELLDSLHGCIRDVDAWLKITCIKHLTKWFLPTSNTGLQIGHDADSVDLDLSLQDPGKAKAFLEKVLLTYANQANIGNLSQIFNQDALDRLVLASGAVPRDYLTLSFNALTRARERNRAISVGKQDVTRAAGDAVQGKIAELEDDVASNEGRATRLLKALAIINAFCIESKRFTFFRISFRDRDAHQDKYSVIQLLSEVRLLHLVNSSVSSAHESGVRYEAYMLDLSQFSGDRMMRKLSALDFRGGYLALDQTGTRSQPKIAKSPLGIITILRSGPIFQLEQLVAAMD